MVWANTGFLWRQVWTTGDWVLQGKDLLKVATQGYLYSARQSKIEQQLALATTLAPDAVHSQKYGDITQ